MMNSHTRPDTKDWLAEKFGLSNNASPDDYRGAFISTLRDEGFLPPPALGEAFQASLLDERREHHWSEHAFFELEDRLRNEIEAFAFDFFTLPPEQRKQRWQDLVSRSSWNPTLTNRLERLRAGLLTDVPNRGDDRAVQTVANAICSTFTLPPTAKAIQRHMVLRRSRQHAKEWRRGARTIKRLYPALASLESGLLDQLAEGGGRPARVPATPVTRQKTTSTSQSSGFGYWWIIVLVVIGMLRIIGSSTNSSRTQTPRNDFRQDNVEQILPQIPPVEGLKDFDKDPLEVQQHEEFKRFMDNLKKRNKKLVPMDKPEDMDKDKP